jgi:hypothetical protein
MTYQHFHDYKWGFCKCGAIDPTEEAEREKVIENLGETDVPTTTYRKNDDNGLLDIMVDFGSEVAPEIFARMILNMWS